MRATRLLRVLSIAALLFVLATPGGADERGGSDALWQPVTGDAWTVPAGLLRARPQVSRTFRMDRGRMEAALAAAPSTRGPVPPAPGDGAAISLPLADGTVAPFLAVDDPILDPLAAAAHPELRTYVVARIDDPTTWGRITWTPEGLHGLVLTPEGASHFEPLYVGDATVHAVYYRRHAEAEVEPFVCHTTGSRALVAPGDPRRSPSAGPSTPTTSRSPPRGGTRTGRPGSGARRSPR